MPQSPAKPPRHLQEVFRYIAKPPPQQRQTHTQTGYGPLRTLYKGYEARHCQPEPSPPAPQPASVEAVVQPRSPASPGGGASRRGTAAVTYAADGELVVLHAARHHSDIGVEGAATSVMSQLSNHASPLPSKGLVSRRPSIGSTELPEEQEPEGEVMHPADREDAQGSSSPNWKSGSQSLAPSAAGSEGPGSINTDPRHLSAQLSLGAAERRDVSENASSPPRNPRPVRASAPSLSGSVSPNAGFLRQGSRSAMSTASSTANSRSNQFTAVGRRVSLQKPVFDSDEDAM